jgi:tryptophan synthase alpha chain
MLERKNNLTIYFTAGYPNLNDTETIILNLEKAGADLIEIGIPYSDPLADGPTIQHSSDIALKNGISIDKIFEQLDSIKNRINIPLTLMGYYNPMLKYGIEKFCKKAKACGVKALIIPDLPLEVFENKVKLIYDQYDLKPVFLITPQTPIEKIKRIDALVNGFIYAVSSASITGGEQMFGQIQLQYFEKLKALKLSNKIQIGFGISESKNFHTACEYADGAIIGSAFIKHITKNSISEKSISAFIANIKNRTL